MNRVKKLFLYMCFVSINITLSAVIFKKHSGFVLPKEDFKASYFLDTFVVYKQGGTLFVLSLAKKETVQLGFKRDIIAFNLSKDGNLLEVCLVNDGGFFDFEVYDLEAGSLVSHVKLLDNSYRSCCDIYFEMSENKKILSGMAAPKTILAFDIERNDYQSFSFTKEVDSYMFSLQNNLKVMFKDAKVDVYETDNCFQDAQKCCFYFNFDNRHDQPDFFSYKLSPNLQYSAIHSKVDRSLKILSMTAGLFHKTKKPVLSFDFFNSDITKDQYLFIIFEEYKDAAFDCDELFGQSQSSLFSKKVQASAICDLSKNKWLNPTQFKKSSCQRYISFLIEEEKEYDCECFLLVVDTITKKLVLKISQSNQVNGLINGEFSLLFSHKNKIVRYSFFKNQENETFLLVHFEDNSMFVFDLQNNKMASVIKYSCCINRRYMYVLLYDKTFLLIDREAENTAAPFSCENVKRAKEVIFSHKNVEKHSFKYSGQLLYMFLSIKDNVNKKRVIFCIYNLKERKIVRNIDHVCQVFLDKEKKYCFVGDGKTQDSLKFFDLERGIQVLTLKTAFGFSFKPMDNYSILLSPHKQEAFDRENIVCILDNVLDAKDHKFYCQFVDEDKTSIIKIISTCKVCIFRSNHCKNGLQIKLLTNHFGGSSTFAPNKSKKNSILRLLENVKSVVGEKRKRDLLLDFKRDEKRRKITNDVK